MPGSVEMLDESAKEGYELKKGEEVVRVHLPDDELIDIFNLGEATC